MTKQTRFLLLISIVSILGILILQTIWLSNYYAITKQRFKDLTQRAIASAEGKEFNYRYDSIEKTLFRLLTDTSRIKIVSRYRPHLKVVQYKIMSVNDTTDKVIFSSPGLAGLINSVDDPEYAAAAAQYAHLYRTDYMQNGNIFYTPLVLGKVADSVSRAYYFDETAFRRFLSMELSAGKITTDFRVINVDSARDLSISWFSETISSPFAVRTNTSRLLQVAVLFKTPYLFVLRQMLFVLIGSFLLIVLIAFCFYRILKSLFTEKHLSAVKNDFISNITHEFKTPIATVNAAMEALQDFGAYERPEKRGRYFSIAERELNRLADMVNRILNISIYERKNVEINKTEFDPGEVINAIVNNYNMIRTKKIDWRVEEQDKILLRADKELFHIALSNVIDNAIKYSGDPVEISIRWYRTQADVRISVKDNGLGMGSGEKQFIFEKFYRIDSKRNNKVNGYGLGLAYTKAILDAHKASYEIHSERGAGTEFILIFPFHD